MPSFRVILTIGTLHPGVAPASIEPTIAAAVREYSVVEATSIDVVSGEARLTVRFTAADVQEALKTAKTAADAAEGCARLDRLSLTERVGGRWFRRA